MSKLAGFHDHRLVPSPPVAPIDPTVADKFVLLEGVVGEGTVLGETLTCSAVAASGNVGTGTITGLSVGAGVRPGAYRLLCIEPAPNGGVFSLEDPVGVTFGRVVVGVPYVGPLRLTLNDGASDFAAGDLFVLTVGPTSPRSVKRATPGATDGTSWPMAIAVGLTNAMGGPVECLAHTHGAHRAEGIVFDSGYSLDFVRSALRSQALYII